MLRVSEQYAGTDTGRQRRANEDSLLARAPLFVVADGMGGAQAGEVASKIAVEAFQNGLEDSSRPEQALASLARVANSRIHELSHSHAEQAGMGTTLTAVYVGERDVSIAHVGDSRAYRLRDGELLRLTEDHSLVDELLRQGRLTPEEAIEHPQRSVITRALGPEGAVEVDTRSYAARDGDVYLLCSDGLTTMVPEDRLTEVLLAHAQLRAAGEALIATANEAGGRDNITVLLLRLEELDTSASLERPGSPTAALGAAAAPAAGAPAGEDTRVEFPPAASAEPATSAAVPDTGEAVSTAMPAAATVPRLPRRPSPEGPASGRKRGRLRRVGAVAILLVVLAVIGTGIYVAMQSVYFIGTNSRGLVTVYRGLPYRLPGGLALYSSDYVSGVSASTLTAQRRRTLLDHSLRSEGKAASLVRSLELGQLE
jgi:PPM family protein phosphatase